MATTASFGAAPVWFEGQPYIDGGYYSSDNADLAAEYGQVLVLALKAPSWAMRLVSVEDGIAELRASGAKVELIQPDDEAMEAITSSGGPMDPAVFEPVTRAGRAQGLRLVAQRGTVGFWYASKWLTPPALDAGESQRFSVSFLGLLLAGITTGEMIMWSPPPPSPLLDTLFALQEFV
ncbi:MAG TPA: hypothetical protein VHP14_09535 [Anaerolineales bacterium]|nr:hypothetical protein [Anaerolineales bacterium]